MTRTPLRVVAWREVHFDLDLRVEQVRLMDLAITAANLRQQ